MVELCDQKQPRQVPQQYIYNSLIPEVPTGINSMLASSVITKLAPCDGTASWSVSKIQFEMLIEVNEREEERDISLQHP